MFTALKKLVGSEAGQDRNIPAGLQSMNQSLQRRFAKGVQYNMKIVIRGDRNTGKSALWHRLQGKKFIEEYIPTQEIQVTSIQWNYKMTDDVVKVEVWDVVDKGQKIPLPESIADTETHFNNIFHHTAGKGKRRGDNLKLENESQESETEMALDAEFLDVYKNCNGVVMIFDITKQWTFNYIMKELPKVPMHLPVCVLGNQRDMGEHRVILPDDIRDLVNSLNRPPGSSYIHYAESSMKNGFGLRYLHRFFNIPFLKLQRWTLLRQLDTNEHDIDATLEELNVQKETEEQNYDIFMEMMESHKTCSSPSNGQSPSSGSHFPLIFPGAVSPSNFSPSTPQVPVPLQHHLVLDTHLTIPSIQTSAPIMPQPPSHVLKSPAVAPSTPVAAPGHSAPSAQKRGFISHLFGSSTSEMSPDKSETTPCEAPRSLGMVQNVNDSGPKMDQDQKCLEYSRGVAKSKNKCRAATSMQDNDSDGEGIDGNPLVSSFQDDLDPDDQEPSQPHQAAAPSLGITLTSDEEDENQPMTHMIQDKKLSTRLTVKPAERPQGLKSAFTVPVQNSHKTRSTMDAKSSDSDQEGAMTQQMFSFFMDDPDLETKKSAVAQNKSLTARDDISDKSDDGLVLASLAEPLKNTAPFPKDLNSDIDLFNLQFEESTPKGKESSEDQDDTESKQLPKDKKKKKTTEEVEKSTKKQHKHKKKEKEDSGTGYENEKKKRKSKSKKSGTLDDVDAFLAGEEGLGKSGGK
ncbi:rab-like protein 6 isoform X2 [Brachyhypopomus gauderio]|uniref:rab-like protein 6 isoform X2 n=1 Tax=Brachyhypopomus gauderio TaxID=698409 RepID=UPI0040419B6F